MENSVEELSKIKKTSSFLINVFKFKPIYNYYTLN